MRAVDNTRVSTAYQEHGIHAQSASILAEPVKRSWEVIRLACQGKSDKEIYQSGIRDALSILKAGEATALLVLKLEKLRWSMPDSACMLGLLGNRGWSILALDLNLDTSTSTGKLVASIIASVARWEREVIRTTEALAAAKATGIHGGRPASQVRAVVRRIRRYSKAGQTRRAINLS